MRIYFKIEGIQLFCGSLFFVCVWFLKSVVHIWQSHLLRRQNFSHTYITALFISGEEGIEVKQLELLFQMSVEKRHAVCWISSVQKKDAKRNDRMNKDSRRIILSLTGILQKIHIFKGRTQFHTSHFRRWYEYGDIQIPRTIGHKSFSQTTPIGAVKTSILRILSEEYSRDLGDIYEIYQKRFHRSPFIDTERNVVKFRFDVTCKTSAGELIAQHSFFEEGEPEEQRLLINRFADVVVAWLYRIYT